MNENEEVLDVCEAIQTIADRAAERAAEQKRIDTLLQVINNIMTNMKLTKEQAMNAVGISESDREVIARLLQ